MNPNTQVSGWSILLLRMMLSGIFISAGISHLLKPEQVAQRIDNAAMGDFVHLLGDPYFMGVFTGYVLLIFGVTFLFGIFTRWSALALFMVLVPITITIQLGNGIGHGPLWKNIAIFGGLLFFILNNIKVYSLYTK